MRLLLLRHAKSDWSGNLGDHERPLAPRGRNAAPRMGAYIHARGYEPALVLCSTAERTKETLELLGPSLGNPAIRFERALYLAEWPQLMNEIRAVSTKSTPLLLVGHNPGLEQLAITLALQQPQDAAERARTQKLAQKFPTAALAVLDFDAGDWKAVKPGSGRLIDYMRPKDLRGARGAEE